MAGGTTQSRTAGLEFHSRPVLVPSPGSGGQQVAFVGSVPRALIASTSFDAKDRRKDDGGGAGGELRPATSTSASTLGPDYRGGMYSSGSYLLDNAAGSSRKSSRRKRRMRGGGGAGAGATRSLEGTASSASASASASASRLLPIPAETRHDRRMGPTSSLVDRLASPSAIPPALQAFWERNQGMLPPWARSGEKAGQGGATDANGEPIDHPFAKYNTPKTLRRAAAMREPRAVDYNPDVKGANKLLRKAKDAGAATDPASVEALGISLEMEAALQEFLLQQVGGGIWEDEVLSQLARPMDATHLVRSRELQLRANETGIKFTSATGAASAEVGNLERFPYGVEAHAVATLIQRAYRRRHRRKMHASSLMAALFKGFRTRKPYRVMRLLTLSAVVRIQALLRGRLGRKRWRAFWLALVFRPAAQIQAQWRASRARILFQELLFKRNTRLATVIQTCYRGFAAREFTAHMRWRRNKWLAQRRLASSILLQSYARGFIARRRHWPTILWRVTRQRAARTIQRIIRGFLARRYVGHMVVTRMQRTVRGWLGRLRVRRLIAALDAKEADRRRREEVEVQEAGDKASDETAERLSGKAGKRIIKAEVPAVKRYRAAQKRMRKTMTKKQRRIESVRDTFEMFDIDGSGAIDLSELELLMDQLCIPMTKAELQEVTGSRWCSLLVRCVVLT